MEGTLTISKMIHLCNEHT